MLAAIACAAFGLVPSAVAFALGALAMMALRIVDPDAAYRAVDWPVVVLLGAMMPVAGAIESTGLARVIATGLIDTLAQGHAVLALTMILVVTMTLSDFMKNAATAAVMCPIALGAAGQLDAQPQSFLMAVAIGASCAFLTPIGHQNNTLILDPGGFEVWRLLAARPVAGNRGRAGCGAGAAVGVTAVNYLFDSHISIWSKHRTSVFRMTAWR